MKRILVTGANKGIGLAIAEAILREQPDTGVILGARNPERGSLARESLLQKEPGWCGRIEVQQLDVSSDRSVADAASSVMARHGETPAPLYGLVNNAGIATGDLAEILQVNVYGMHRVCTHFVPLLQSGGRVVNVTSAAGPNFVAECSADRQRLLLDPAISWQRLEGFMQECKTLQGEQFTEKGLGSGSSYGLSKACANAYTLLLSRSNPQLTINACTPGFIETDLTRAMTRGSGKSAADLGMKQPQDGARVVRFLLFAEIESSGHYYGSDCQRSPLDRYRAPGSPAYTGD